MQIKLDEDVMSVIGYMQTQVQARKLVGVARALRELAPLLWGHHEQESIDVLRVVAEPIFEIPSKESSSIESPHDSDRVVCGSAAAVDCQH